MSQETETKSAKQLYKQWVSQLKNREEDAWDILLKYYSEDLRRDILSSLRKRRLPEEWLGDIEQETWLTAIKRIEDFVWESEDKFYNWLRVISLNHLRRYQRVEGRAVSLADSEDGDVQEELENFVDAWQSYEMSVEDQTELKEIYAALDTALRTLKPREQEILLHWLAGKKPRELALMYDIQASSVSMVLMRAKDKIRTTLKNNSLFSE
jgi:RNA polymerase sigma factor (sigma-70 family)